MKWLLAALFAGTLALAQYLPWPGNGPYGAQPPSANQILWISADCITLSGGTCSTPADGTSNPSTWADRSPAANNMSYSAGTCTFHTSQLNSKPAITASSGCKYTPATALATGYVSGNTVNVFLVYKRNDSSSNFDFFTCTATSVNCLEYRSNGSNLQVLCDPRVACYANGAAAPNTSWNQVNFTLGYGTTSTASFRLNEAADGSATTGITGISAATNGTCCLTNDSDFPFTGQFAEMIFYAASGSGLSAGQITQVETYLNTKYGI